MNNHTVSSFINAFFNSLFVGGLIIMSFNYANGQSTILKGQIVDNSSHFPLKYVNIGIIGGNIGTVSNQEGNFTLSVPDSIDSGRVRVSVYGYEPMTFELSKLFDRSKETDPIIISLKSHIQEVAEVHVLGQELKTKIIGRKTDSGKMALGFLSEILGTEMGIFVKIKKRSYVDDFNFYVNNSDYDTLTFRINFYACDKKGNPTDSLLAESVIFKLNGISTGPVKINLKEYYITLRENTYLSLEVVDGFNSEDAPKVKTNDLKHLGLTFGAELGGNASYRYTSQSAWQNITLVAPGLYLTVRQ